jgi:serine/threonine protein kinase
MIIKQVSIAAVFFISYTIALKLGEDGYEGFPVPGETVILVGRENYLVKDFLGAGPKKRAYRARRITLENDKPTAQAYAYPQEPGTLLTDVDLTEEVVVKCSATDQIKRINKLEHEFKSLSYLNGIQSVRKPVGLYLSKQWRCFDDAEFICQYLVMTIATSDVQKLLAHDSLYLRSPQINGVVQPNEEAGRYSFELFLATFALSLVSELEKLHSVGLVHRDISVKNVALDPSDLSRVYLIDMGSSSFLSDYASTLGKVEDMVNHDFRRVKRVSLQLIAQAVQDLDDTVDVTQHSLYSIIAGTTSIWEFRLRILAFLEEHHPSIKFDNRIIYQ